MAQILHADKEIKLKIVYYGPALSGKTTNLIYIHQVLFPSQKVKLFSINTGDDRTLFFDLLPLELGRVSGYNLTLQLFTVPGQVRYDQTRRAVLNGADGVVFVADSNIDQDDANQESFDNLKINLAVNAIDFDTTPVILQYNKQDLKEIHSVAEMDRRFNKDKLPSFGANALAGVGVLQTLKQAITRVLENFNKEFPELSMTEIENKIDRSFDAVLDAYQKRSQVVEKIPDAETAFAQTLKNHAHNIQVMESRSDLDQEHFLDKAVETNIKLAELYHQLNDTSVQLQQKNRELTILGEINQALTGDFAPEKLPHMIFRSILMSFETANGVFLAAKTGAKELTEKYLSGFNHDPLHNILTLYGDSVASQLFALGQPLMFNAFDYEDVVIPGKPVDQLAAQLRKFKIMAFMSLPIAAGKIRFGLLNIYQLVDESSVLQAWNQEHLHFATRLGATLTLALERTSLPRHAPAAPSVDTENGDARQIRRRLEALTAQNRDCQRRLAKLETFFEPVLRMDVRRDLLLGNFMSEISKPISSILMAGKVLEKFGIHSEENLSRFLQVSRDESARLNHILEKFEGGTDKYFDAADFNTEVFAVDDLLQPVQGVYLPKIEQKRLLWRQDIPDDLPRIRGDKEKFQFVLGQFVDNALQFTSTGHIELKLQYNPVYNDRFLVLSVADSGVGIPKADLPKVFDRFFKGVRDTEGSANRFGLGLAFCKEIIEFHRGRIWIKSEEGVSTTIYAEIPVAQPVTR
ncbi:MAG: hypothetical protein JXQ27_03845 [Acidobacteria bacterium]|nr:hypothetical protein [Acidobacteriota bacterium]